MIPFPNIDPDIIRIGPIRIRWYGLMYILGFVASYFLIQRQKRAQEIGLKGETVQDLMVYLIVGLVIGARFGFLLFYQYDQWGYYLSNPVEIIAVWHGGMSFHGGLIGAIAAGFWFCRKKRIPIPAAADCVFVTAPVGLGLGRIGNFINGELFGRPADVPWAMIFPDGGNIPRHPSQLYEAALEGLVLFIILWLLRKKNFKDGMMVVFFLLFYGLFRFFAEFFREPDPQIGLLLGQTVSMGQILCLSMMAAAGVLAIFIHRKT
ncbi:MAG: prolipoprotein diacylglyceryl transferase [Desulfobacterales bacterium]